MGKAHLAGDYAVKVKLHLTATSVTTKIAQVARYLENPRSDLAANWGKSWETIGECVIRLDKWKTWAIYEVDPFSTSSEAYSEACELGQIFHQFVGDSFWDAFSDDEYDLLEPLAYLVEDVCRLHGINAIPVLAGRVIQDTYWPPR